MLSILIAGAIAVAMPQATDTTIAVPQGTRLKVRNPRGEVIVRSWERDQVRVQARHDRDASLDISLRGGELDIGTRGRRGHARDTELILSVPRWMNLHVGGTFTDAHVEGVEAEVSVETTHGDVTVRGGREYVSIRTSNGDVILDGARGSVRLESSNGDLHVSRVEGDITAETLNGEIDLRRITSSQVVMSTINGDIDYEGTIDRGGRYRFATHNGDVTIFAPRDFSASVSVSTVQGEFESDCPVRLTGAAQSGKRFSFTVGGGSASVEIESFGGEIRLRARGGCW